MGREWFRDDGRVDVAREGCRGSECGQCRWSATELLPSRARGLFRYRLLDQWMWRIFHPSGVRASTIVSVPWLSISRPRKVPFEVYSLR